MKIGSAVRLGRVPEKKTRQDKTGHESQIKKSQSGNISPIWGDAPTAPIETKICIVDHLADIITYAKFQVEIFMGYDFIGGRISHFPIDFCMGLTTFQRDCAVMYCHLFYGSKCTILFQFSPLIIMLILLLLHNNL